MKFAKVALLVALVVMSSVAGVSSQEIPSSYGKSECSQNISTILKLAYKMDDYLVKEGGVKVENLDEVLMGIQTMLDLAQMILSDCKFVDNNSIVSMFQDMPYVIYVAEDNQEQCAVSLNDAFSYV